MAQPLSFAQRAGVIGLLAQTFAAIGTVAYVETRTPEEKRAARSSAYAELAATIVATSILGSVWLAFDELEGAAAPKRLR